MSTACFAFAQTPPGLPATSKGVLFNVLQKKAGKGTVIESDTSKENQELRYFYVTAGANVFVNTKGGAAKGLRYRLSLAKPSGYSARQRKKRIGKEPFF